MKPPPPPLRPGPSHFLTPSHPRPAVPLAPRRRCVGSSSRLLGVLADPAQAQQGRDEPADGGQEGKGLVGAPGAAAGAAEAQAAPVEGAAAADAAELVDEQAERGEPAGRQDEVGGPVGEAAREGEQPQQREQDGQAGDDLGVDEAREVPRGVVRVVEVVARDAGDDGGEDELRQGD